MGTRAYADHRSRPCPIRPLLGYQPSRGRRARRYGQPPGLRIFRSEYRVVSPFHLIIDLIQTLAPLLPAGAHDRTFP
jgi:hypothetical protein